MNIAYINSKYNIMFNFVRNIFYWQLLFVDNIVLLYNMMSANEQSYFILF